MIKRVGLFCFFFGFAFSAHAVHVGEVTTMIHSDKDMIAKEIKNTTESARLITINVSRLSSPMDDGKIIPTENKDELLFTPANLILTGHGVDQVRFFYHGPKDNKERYYRIRWTDQAVSEDEGKTAKKAGTATTSAVINTILVVAPRKEKFDYEYKDGIVYNRGNVAFRVLGFGTCLNKKDIAKKDNCRERYYVMPGRGIKLMAINHKDSKAHIGIWHGERYITVK